MRHVPSALAICQRNGNALDADGHVSLSRRCKNLKQMLVRLRIARTKNAIQAAQRLTHREHRKACGIGMDNAACGIHQKHASVQAVENA